MNKPAAKEPSMDEILSSIRQIIADDDTAASTAGPAEAASDPDPVDEALSSFDAFLAEELPKAPAMEDIEPEPEEEPLALSLDQVVEKETIPEPDFSADLAAEEAEEPVDFSLPDDVAFVGADDLGPEIPEPEPEPVLASGSATMPDPMLSEDLADHLLDSTAQAAASHAFARLGNFGVGAGGQTIEGMVREMLKPMLKSWLDENLPAVVERLVEREIERVSRGGR